MSPARAARRAPRRHRFRDDDLGPPSGVVAIVGRPNTGKSTLFNRLTGTGGAIVDETAGLTRDRLYAIAEWRGRRFTVVDTAGLDLQRPRGEREDMAALRRGTEAQTRLAVDESDLLLFVVDVRTGVTPLDEEVAAVLRIGSTPVVLVGNKADSDRDPYYAHELHRLGLGEPILISALQGKDTGDLLDIVVAALPPPDLGDDSGAAHGELRVAIVGRPNVGKSSLLNAVVGEERALVSSIPGTTRDAVDTLVMRGEQRVRLIDTAGIRRRGMIDTDVEHFSLLRSLRALDRADVGVVVVDAAEGVVAQDRHIAGYAVDAGAGVVIAANKWDLVPQEERADPAFLKAFATAFDFVPGVPVLTLSATEGRNVSRVLDAAATVSAARATRIGTGPLNTLLRRAVDEHPPPKVKGRRLKLLYATQARSAIPTIVLFVNDPELMHFAYVRYLENRIRSVFGFNGVRLRMVTRPRAAEE